MKVTDARSAVKTAKEYLAALLADENVSDVGLEELEYNEHDGVWIVTLGFSRPWDRNALAAMVGQNPKWRTYRALKIGKDGEVISISRRSGDK